MRKRLVKIKKGKVVWVDLFPGDGSERIDLICEGIATGKYITAKEITLKIERIDLICEGIATQFQGKYITAKEIRKN